MLTENDYIQAAKELGCEVNAIKAVSKVEAPRGGFDSKGNVTILFEPYIFYKLLRKKGIDTKPYLEKFPTLISNRWNPKLYGKYSQQWDKLKGAANIDTTCAYEATSYGEFQILGTNAISIGYKDVFDFFYHMQKSEDDQLEGFVRYIKANNLEDELQHKDWAGFSIAYNGPLYRKNNYATKLKKAYASF